MKTKRLLILPLLFNYILGSGQEIPETITLNSALTGTQEKVASNWIQLNPGFSYTASSGNYFFAGAGQQYANANEGDLIGGPEGTIGDLVGNDGVVGAINGNFTVSNTGAAIYSILIECPAGINGMTPSASLVYNSQAGNSIAGLGWNIGGLSAITRSPNTYYYDNKTEGISWSSIDNFSLDGKRLIMGTKYPSGSSVSNADSIDYEFDSDPAVKVRGYAYNAMGPEKFKVWVNGKIMEYKQYQALATQSSINTYGRVESYPFGEIIDSTETENKRFTTAWYLTSTADNYGNRIIYKYDYDSTLVSTSPGRYYYDMDDTGLNNPYIEEDLVYGNYYFFIGNTIDQYTYKNFKLKEIDYAGNAYKLLFNYEAREDKIISYINGKKIVNESRLSSVSVLYQNTNQLRNYTLEYSKVDSLEIYSKLIKIKLTGGNGDSYNSTVFDWEKTAYSYDKSANYNLVPSPAHINRVNSGWGCLDYTFYPADFNGDGITDFFGKYEYTDFEVNRYDWAVYLNNGDVFSLTDSGYGNIPDNGKFYLLDNDQDGKTELFMQYAATLGGVAYVKFQGYKYNGTSVVRNENLDFVLRLADQTTSENVDLVHADFNGDGQQDFLLLNVNLEYVNSDLVLGTIPVFGHSESYFLNDFNGNGKPEIVFLKDNKIEFWEYNASTSKISLIYSDFGLNKDDIFYPGDFNGDGNMDILVYDKSATIWKILTSTGLDLSTSIIQPPALIASGNPLNNMVGDFNQDGKTDILQKHPIYVNNDLVNFRLELFISTGTGFNLSLTEPAVLTLMWWFQGEANNDLTTDCFERNQTPCYFSISKGKGFNQINKVYTGNGQEIDISYMKSYSNNERSISLVSEVETLPKVLSAPILLKTVATVTSGKTTASYYYSGPVLCTKGSWFMGFANIENTTKQGTMTSSTVNHYKSILYGSSRYAFIPDSTVNLIGTNLISCSSSHYKQVNFSDKFYLVPAYTVSYDVLNGTKLIKSFTDYDSYLFPSLLNTKSYAGSTVEAEVVDSLTYLHTTTNGKWIIGEVTKKRTTQRRPGEIDFRQKLDYEYFSNGALKTEYLEKGTLKEIKKSYEYDSFGNVLKVTNVAVNDEYDSRVRESFISYTPDGRFMTSKTDVLGNTATFSYNVNSGTIASQTDANNLTTSYTYDGFGRLKKTVSPDNNEVTVAFCWTGDNSDAPDGTCYYSYKKSSGIAPVTVFYDKYGKELRTVTLGLSGDKLYNDKQYDSSDRLLKESMPYFSGGTPLWIVYGYDGLSRISTITNPDGSIMRYSYGERQLTSSVEISGATQSTTKKRNSLGEAIESIDNAGNSVFTRYFASGLPKEIQVEGQSQKISFTYDIFGNRTSISDPDAGTVTSVYNSLRDLVSQIDSKNNASSYTYDKAGRVLTKTTDGIQTTYIYDTEFKGAVSSVSNSLNSISYLYDDIGRIESQTETLFESGGNKTVTTGFTYDQYGRTKTKTWSTGYSVTYDYNVYGDLIKISNSSTTIWNGTIQNAYGQFTAYSQGQYGTTVSINEYGEISQVNTPGVRNMKYVFDDFNNLYSREDLFSNQKEIFSYDNLNRLTNIAYYSNNIHIPAADKTMYYDNYGNITGKTGIAARDSIGYGENGFGPHAVTSIRYPESYSPLNQKISYTDFNKAESIIDTLADGTTHSLQITYGFDQQRSKSIYSEGSTSITKYFFGDYEEVTEGTTTTKYFYIGSPTGVAGIYVLEATGSGNLHFTFNDHIGSLTEIVNSSTGVVTHQSFDAWGNSRSAADWRNASAVPLFADRGFTGHEHLEKFALINMNGRMYDPALGRFLSPDPYVQMPDFSQNFNRYAYCLNNPLIYSDPNGESIVAIMMLGAFINTMVQDMAGNIHNAGDLLMAAGIGAISSAAGAYVGQAVAGALGATTTFGGAVANGATVGLCGGYAGGFVGGSGNAWMNGADFGQGLQAGLIGGRYGAAFGLLLGGISGGMEYKNPDSYLEKLDGGEEPVYDPEKYTNPSAHDMEIKSLQNKYAKGYEKNILHTFSDKTSPPSFSYSTDYGLYKYEGVSNKNIRFGEYIKGKMVPLGNNLFDIYISPYACENSLQMTYLHEVGHIALTLAGCTNLNQQESALYYRMTELTQNMNYWNLYWYRFGHTFEPRYLTILKSIMY